MVVNFQPLDSLNLRIAKTVWHYADLYNLECSKELALKIGDMKLSKMLIRAAYFMPDDISDYALIKHIYENQNVFTVDFIKHIINNISKALENGKNSELIAVKIEEFLKRSVDKTLKERDLKGIDYQVIDKFGRTKNMQCKKVYNLERIGNFLIFSYEGTVSLNEIEILTIMDFKIAYRIGNFDCYKIVKENNSRNTLYKYPIEHNTDIIQFNIENDKIEIIA
jgi:hypothetical protein